MALSFLHRDIQFFSEELVDRVLRFHGFNSNRSTNPSILRRHRAIHETVIGIRTVVLGLMGTRTVIDRSRRIWNHLQGCPDVERSQEMLFQIIGITRDVIRYNGTRGIYDFLAIISCLSVRAASENPPLIRTAVITLRYTVQYVLRGGIQTILRHSRVYMRQRINFLERLRRRRLRRLRRESRRANA